MQQEVIHPNWPSIWPRLLTDGKLLVNLIIKISINNNFGHIPFDPITYSFLKNKF